MKFQNLPKIVRKTRDIPPLEVVQGGRVYNSKDNPERYFSQEVVLKDKQDGGEEKRRRQGGRTETNQPVETKTIFDKMNKIECTRLDGIGNLDLKKHPKENNTSRRKITNTKWKLPKPRIFTFHPICAIGPTTREQFDLKLKILGLVETSARLKKKHSSESEFST